MASPAAMITTMRSTTGSQEKRLFYYGFQEVSVARTLAALVGAGRSLSEIDRLADRLASAYPQIDRPLVELPIVVDEGALLLRSGDELTEPGGQKRFDFDLPTDLEEDHSGVLVLPEVDEVDSVDDARSIALELRDQGATEQAIEAWRLVLTIGPAEAEDHFALAELLYEEGDPTAASRAARLKLRIPPSNSVAWRALTLSKGISTWLQYKARAV